MKNLTPERYRCEVCASCPAVYDAGDGTLVIIGKHVTSDDHSGIVGRIGEGEAAVQISADLVRDALGGPVIPPMR